MFTHSCVLLAAVVILQEEDESGELCRGFVMHARDACQVPQQDTEEGGGARNLHNAQRVSEILDADLIAIACPYLRLPRSSKCLKCS